MVISSIGEITARLSFVNYFTVRSFPLLQLNRSWCNGRAFINLIIGLTTQKLAEISRIFSIPLILPIRNCCGFIYRGTFLGMGI